MSDSGDSIIDLYRQALNSNNNNKEDLIKEVSNSVELLKNDVVIEETNSDDPLQKFLFKLTDILKENQKSEEPSLIEEITETIENQENTKEEIKKEEKIEDISEDVKKEKDPLEKFLFKLNDIIVANKNEQVKTSALNLIEQLKNKEDAPEKVEEIKEEPKETVKEIPLPPQPELGQVPNVTPPLSPVKKTVKPLPKKKNEYVKELESADKDLPKVSKETDQQKSIKEEVQKYIKEFLGKYRNGVVAEGGGGDGNFSTEFKNGGTMYGSLNVTGQYLSAGVPLTNIFGSGGGSSDRLIAGLQELILKSDGTIIFPDDTIRTSDGKLLSIEAETLALSSFTKIALSGNAFYAYDSNGNAITFDTTDNEIVLTTQGTNSWTFGNTGTFSGPNNVLEITGDLNTSNKILSGGVDLADIFLTSETDSQTLSFNDTTSQLSISNGNTVPLSGYVIPNIKSITQNYLPLSGGTLTGDLDVYGNTFINNNLTVGGSLTALGTATFANTVFATTSALSVINIGAGPALYVFQAAGPYDVASFYDGDGVEVLHVGNANPNGLGRVGVNESFPNKELTVRGSISATENIYVQSIDANVSILSGGVDLANIFLTTETDSQTLWWDASSYNLSISNGNTVSLGSLSSTGGGTGRDDVNTVVISNSANWIDTTTIVQSNSAFWFEPVRKFDYVTVANIDYSYSGTALYGTSESSFSWKIIRLTYNNNGTIFNSASALNSWTGRLTATYI